MNGLQELYITSSGENWIRIYNFCSPLLCVSSEICAIALAWKLTEEVLLDIKIFQEAKIILSGKSNKIFITQIWWRYVVK